MITKKQFAIKFFQYIVLISYIIVTSAQNYGHVIQNGDRNNDIKLYIENINREDISILNQFSEEHAINFLFVTEAINSYNYYSTLDEKYEYLNNTPLLGNKALKGDDIT